MPKVRTKKTRKMNKSDVEPAERVRKIAIKAILDRNKKHQISSHLPADILSKSSKTKTPKD